MKLHLPKKFKTALMAAFATVSFTTVSTASLGAAVFAFAGYQAAAEETATTEESAADKAGQEEIRDNIRALQEEQDEEDEREATVDPADQGIMERRAKNLERAGDGAASGIAKAAYDAMEAEIFNPEAAAAASSEQQQASASSAELPSDDLGFTSNPYATTSTGNSEPVFEVTPAAATTTDFLQETSSEQESTGSSSSGSSSPASASGFGGSADSGYSGGGYSPFGLALGSIAPISVGGTDSLVSAPLLGDASSARNLVWEGDSQSKGTWQNGGEDTTSPWRFTPEADAPVAKAFHNGDYAEFNKDAEVTVVGTVQTASIQLHKGTEEMQVLTINTSEGATLTADQVTTVGTGQLETDFNNKIITKGDGEIDFTISDLNFGTALSIENASAAITFEAAAKITLYKDITGSTSSNVALKINSDTTAEEHTTIKGINQFNVANGAVLQIESSMAELYGGGFFLDKDNTTINLGEKSTLSVTNSTDVTTKHLTITGTGTGENQSTAYFGSMYLFHGPGTAVHKLSNSVDALIETLTVDKESPDTIMQIDDASTLLIRAMHSGYYSSEETFLHAFKNGGTETDRQEVTINNLVTHNRVTIHLGAAASSEQGASSDYQEAGTVHVKYLQGYPQGFSGMVVFENDVVVTTDSQQCLNEVFHLDAENYQTYDERTGEVEPRSYSGHFRLAAANDGRQDRRKSAVLVFHNSFSAYDGNIELQADADYTDYALVIDPKLSPFLSTNGIYDVPGHELQEHSTAMIYSGTVDDTKDAKITPAETQRSLQLYAAKDTKYVSSFGISSGIDIEFTGAGSQTFKGSFKDFKGNVTVGGTKEAAGTLSIIEQETALNIKNLLLRPDAKLNVKDANGQNQLIQVSGTLTAQNYVPGTSLEGSSAVVNGNLEMEADSTYDVSHFWGDGGLNLNGSLTFDKGAQLSEADMAMINDMPLSGPYSKYDLAFNVTSLFDSTEESGWTEDGKMIGNPIDASTIFTGQFWKGEYYICYSGLNQGGGYGGNVGTVYLYHALPEPTTGTLSLLALAALAARRRRK